MQSIIWSGVLQGLGLGMVFVSLSTLTFATLDPRDRPDATALFSLVRNIGSSVGISIVTVILDWALGADPTVTFVMSAIAILGLLAIRPWTTYELAKQMERITGVVQNECKNHSVE